MKNINFELQGNIILEISSDIELVFSEKEKTIMSAYVPGLKQINDPGKRADITILHIQSNQTHLIDEGVKVTLQADWSDGFSGDFYHLLYGMARRVWLNKSMYPIHSMCVSSKKNTLVIGHSGSGKTTTALKLVNDHEFKLFSGNKTLVEFGSRKLKATAGTKTITINKDDVKSDSQNGINYWDRYAFKLNSDKTSAEGALNIDSIVIVRLNPHKNTSTKLEASSAMHKLYPYFLDSVNADVIVGNNDLLNGEISKEYKRKLVSSLVQVLPDIPTYSITGSLDYVTNTIADL